MIANDLQSASGRQNELSVFGNNYQAVDLMALVIEAFHGFRTNQATRTSDQYFHVAGEDRRVPLPMHAFLGASRATGNCLMNICPSVSIRAVPQILCARRGTRAGLILKMKILVSALACNPRLGSESYFGWAGVQCLARDHELWVLTSPRNREDLDRARTDGRLEENVRFIYTGRFKQWHPKR